MGWSDDVGVRSQYSVPIALMPIFLAMDLELCAQRVKSLA